MPGEGIDAIQRRRLIAAAGRLAAERGAVGVTVTRVVDRAGVSRRTFYELFDDREQIVLAALEQALVAARAAVLPAWQGTGSWAARVRAALVELLSFCDEQPVAARLLVLESVAAGPTVMGRRVEVLQRLAEAVDEGRRAAGSKTGGPRPEVSGTAKSRPPSSPPATTAEGLVGGALAIVHARLLHERTEPLVALTSQLTSMIVLPYLGAAAARRELGRPTPERPARVDRGVGEDGAGSEVVGRDDYGGGLGALPIRLTGRTVSVLEAISSSPGASNRAIGLAAEVSDQGQISKLLRRLARHGLIENGTLDGAMRGAPNAWTLTERGAALVGMVRGAE